MANKLDLIAVDATIEFEWVETSSVGFHSFMVSLEINLSLTEGAHIRDYLENDEMRYYRHLIEFQSLENHREEDYHALNAWFPYGRDPLHKESIPVLLGFGVNYVVAEAMKARKSMCERDGVELFGDHTPHAIEKMKGINQLDPVSRAHLGGLVGIGADEAQPILDRLAREI